MTDDSGDLEEETPFPPWLPRTLLVPRLSNGQADKLDDLVKQLGVDHPDRSTIAEARQMVYEEQSRLVGLEVYLEYLDSAQAKANEQWWFSE